MFCITFDTLCFYGYDGSIGQGWIIMRVGSVWGWITVANVIITSGVSTSCFDLLLRLRL